MMRLTATKYGECFSNITATIPLFAPRQKLIFPLIAIVICIASNTTLYQKYQLAFPFQEFQSKRQFLDFSRATEKTVDDKINIKPFIVHKNITTKRSNKSNNDVLFRNESNINKTTAVVNDVPSGKDVITLFDKNSKYQNCWLSTDINLLGCGIDGHAFLATMNCPHPVTNTNINRHDVVLKISTEWHAFNNTEEGKQRIYISEKHSSLKFLVRLHHLVMDNTTAKIRQYFALPIGTATFQKNLLLKEVYTNKKSSKKCMGIIPKSSTTTTTSTTSNTTLTFTTNDETMLGTIMEYRGSNKLRPQKLTDPKDRRRVVKDLVCIYHHMYRRKFLQQDIKWFHFHFNGNHTSMIDFSRIDNLRDRHKARNHIVQIQQVQQYQLMALIGNVCSQNYDKYRVMNRVSVKHLVTYTPLLSSMISDLKLCEFNNMKPSSSSNIALFGDNITTSETYQTLLDLLDEKCQ